MYFINSAYEFLVVHILFHIFVISILKQVIGHVRTVLSRDSCLNNM